MTPRLSRSAAAWVVLGTLTACSAGSVPVPQTVAIRADQTASESIVGKSIKHVVIVIQENRSFDNLFAGFPGADTTMFGYMHNGKRVALESIPFEVNDMDHSFDTAIMDWDNGKMNGFDLNAAGGGKPIGRFAYSHLERSEVAPYWVMAKSYVLADHMFPTMFGPSFTGHLSLIAGTADLSRHLSEADTPTEDPWGCDAPADTTTSTVNEQRVVSGGGPFPCLTQFRTMADTLDAAKVSWKYYAPVVSGPDPGGAIWSTFDSIKSVRYGPDWSTRIVSPPSQVLIDAKKGKLASVSWVVPDWLWSDHPYAGTAYGPSWVAAVVNAIGKSPDWRSTAIVVVWDDWGGFFDNVPPPQLDFRGLGIRVGCLIISPYVRPHVSKTVYEFGSILKFVEQVFGLPPLGPTRAGYTETRSRSIVDSFDFTQKPRAFKLIPAPYPASFFIEHGPSLRAPDDQ